MPDLGAGAETFQARPVLAWARVATKRPRTNPLLELARTDPRAALASLDGLSQAVEALAYRAALERCGWSVAAAAAFLGMPKHSTLASKLVREKHLAELRAEYEQKRAPGGRPPAPRATLQRK